MQEPTAGSIPSPGPQELWLEEQRRSGRPSIPELNQQAENLRLLRSPIERVDEIEVAEVIQQGFGSAYVRTPDGRTYVIPRWAPVRVGSRWKLRTTFRLTVEQEVLEELTEHPPITTSEL